MERKTNVEVLNNVFQMVRVSALLENDDIFCYTPKNEEEAEIKENIIKAITSGMPDFRAQVKRPYLGEDDNLSYTTIGGRTDGYNLIWWNWEVSKIWPEKKSCIGTPLQRYAFLGCLIKELHEKYQYTIEEAWNAVCTSTEELKNYDGVWKDLNAWLITLEGASDAIIFGGCGDTIASSRKAGWWTAFEGFSFAVAWVVCDE